MVVRDADVALSPGVGFGPGGEGFARFALIENVLYLLALAPTVEAQIQMWILRAVLAVRSIDPSFSAARVVASRSLALAPAPPNCWCPR